MSGGLDEWLVVAGELGWYGFRVGVRMGSGLAKGFLLLVDGWLRLRGSYMLIKG